MTQGLQEDLRDLTEIVDEAKSELSEVEAAPTVPPGTQQLSCRWACGIPQTGT